MLRLPPCHPARRFGPDPGGLLLPHRRPARRRGPLRARSPRQLDDEPHRPRDAAGRRRARLHGAANDEAALHDGTLHVNGTGFPWQNGSNVYIAGHRMGFPGTEELSGLLGPEQAGGRRRGHPDRRRRHALHLQVFKKLRRQPRRRLRHAAGPRQEHRQPADVYAARLLARLIVQAELTSVSLA